MGKLINFYQDKFIVIPKKILLDKRIDVLCKGLLCTIYALPANLPITVECLCAQIPDIDTLHVQKILENLSAYGYLACVEKDGEEIWKTI